MQINASRFRATCLRLIDRVVRTREPIIITKRGKIVARLVPDHDKPRGLGTGGGSIEILCTDEELFQLGSDPRCRQRAREPASSRVR
jgi:prevent-host-death family protein